MKKFDPTKPVRTRDGRPARILTTDRRCRREDNYKYPIVALVTDGAGLEFITSHMADGTYCDGQESPTDLVNIPSKKEGWVNIYTERGLTRTGMYVFKTRAEAEKTSVYSGKEYKYIATTKIEWEE